MAGPFLDNSAMRMQNDNQNCSYHTMVNNVDKTQVTYKYDNTTCGYPSVIASTCPLKQGDNAYIAHLQLMK